MIQHTYNVLLARASEAQTDVQFNGMTVKANVPALIVHLQPTELADESSNIKLVFPGVAADPTFVEGTQVKVTFEAA
jgi:hypothetical protein